MDDCQHTDKRAILGRTGGDGLPIYGAPPKDDHEPAWCYICGSLWCQTMFGWAWLACVRDRGAPTLANILRAEERKKK